MRFLVSFLCLAGAVAAAAQEPEPGGLVEETGRRLIQLDFSVSGPAESLADLTGDDFALFVDGEPIEEFFFDPVLVEGETATLPVTYIFYFDQPLLSFSGRWRALERARGMIPELITGGSRGMIVSSGLGIETVADLTTDSQLLLSALDALEKNAEAWSWSITPTVKSTRLGQGGKNKGFAAGRLPASSILATDLFEFDEWACDRQLHRLTLFLGGLANLDPPVLLLYFAGEPGASPEARERLVNAANAHDVRIYPIADVQSDRRWAASTDHSVIVTQRAFTRWEGIAATHHGRIAAGTGGHPFIRDESASGVRQRLRKDIARLCFVSFDPGGLQLDHDLEVRLDALRPKVKVQIRDGLRVLSASARRTAELLGAFATPESVSSGRTLVGNLIPTEFEGGKFSVLAQVVLPEGSTLKNARWDIGASLLGRGVVQEQSAVRVQVQREGTPVVFEAELSFPAGPHELVMVANETNEFPRTFSQLTASTLENEWPVPGKGDPFVLPVSVLQPTEAAFVRDGEVRKLGSLALPARWPAATDRPTVLLSLVCRGSGKKPLRIERSLSGDTGASFADVVLESSQACIQLRDMVPELTMTEGEFSYEVSVHRRDEKLTSRRHRFFALAGSTSP